MAFYTYNQSLVTVLFGGIPLTDLAEGSSVKITVDGGGIEKTEGTDGAAINIATMQGATIKVTVKETSFAHEILQGQILGQQVGAPGLPLVVMSGTMALHTIPEAYVSTPGELSTGDKKMGSQEYTFIGTEYVRS